MEDLDSPTPEGPVFRSCIFPASQMQIELKQEGRVAIFKLSQQLNIFAPLPVSTKVLLVFISGNKSTLMSRWIYR